MISKQEYQRRQGIRHTWDPDPIWHGGVQICKYCTLEHDAECHDMGELATGEEDNRQMEDGLGSIATIKVVRAYLESAKTSLYGQAWDIKQKERREEAARWLAREVDRINAIRNMAMSSSSPVELIVERARRMEI